MRMPRRAKGDGCIYRERNGSWRGYVTVGRRADGKVDRRWVRARSKAELLAKLAELRAAVAREELPPPGQQTVADYLREWLQQIRGTVQPVTWRGYETVLRLHVIPRIGHLRLRAVQGLTLQRLYRDLAEAGVGTARIRRAHVVLHRALRQAVQWGLIARNPADAAQPPQHRRREVPALSADEAVAVLRALREDELWPLFAAAALTGLREGELRALRWEDVDLERGMLSVRRSLGTQGSVEDLARELEEGTRGTKTSASARAVPLAPSLVEILRDHRRRQAEARLAAGPAWHDLGLVFCRGDGLPYRAEYLLRRLRTALARAGLRSIRFHDLRHLVATILAEADVDLHLISHLLGHSSLEVTHLYYAHATARAKRRAVERLEELLRPGLR